MKKTSIILLIAIATILTGCIISQDKLISKFLPSEIDTYARKIIDISQDNDLESLKLELHNDILATEDIDTKLTQVLNYTNKSEIKDLIPTSVQVFSTNNNKQYTVNYQASFQDTWQVFTLVIESSDENKYIKGFHVTNLDKPLQEFHKFTFANKGFKHYLFFIFNILYFIIITIAIVKTVKNKELQKKWLWIIISLVGVIKFSFNWSTGAWDFNIIAIGFNLSGTNFLMPYMPTILSFYLPIGAVITLIQNTPNDDQRIIWTCPECGSENQDETIKCLCGYTDN